ncbi:MAG: transposase [Planctomycetota bacterium]
MVRAARMDSPGQFHHVFNRAARRQILFADRPDYRRFQSLLACSYRRGELIIQAYCLMGTHFHLLAASPSGSISHALMRVQNAYARYRNRRSRVDGPLMRGRFGSRPVRSERYWRVLLRYLAHNPTQAGICGHPFEYPYGSAFQFALDRPSRWFDRIGVERRLALPTDATQRVLRYADVIQVPLQASEAAFVKRRMTARRGAEDAIDTLYAAPPAHVAAYMARKTRTGGGQSPWSPMASPGAVRKAIRELNRQHGGWRVGAGRMEMDAYVVLEAGLLADWAGLTTDETGTKCDCHGATAWRRIRRHRDLIATDTVYLERAGVAASRAMQLTLPG